MPGFPVANHAAIPDYQAGRCLYRRSWINRPFYDPGCKLGSPVFSWVVAATVHAMSKAFTKESDDTDEDELQLPAIPSGGKNYITPQGYATLKAELLDLIDNERPKVVEVVHWAASNGDRSENGDYLYGKKRLREIDRRIRFLTKRMEIAEIADPAVHHGNEQVFFGATVTYADDAGVERTVRIIGIDEADSSKGEVSWISPIARTLLKARVGDELKLVMPDRVGNIEVLAVQYPAPVPG